MNSDECSASLRVLLAVVRADGQIHQREKEALAFLAHLLDVPPPSLSTELDVETECGKIRDAKLKRLTFSAALVLADIDEERSPEETDLLARIHRALDLPGEPEASFTKAAHRARMAQVTHRLTEANAEFFRKVAKASSGGAIDAKDYAALIEQLDETKRRLLEGVFVG